MARAEITIDLKRCKGCGICIDLCPAGVLKMEKFKAGVDDIEKCTGCMGCELRCPDFAISVVRKNNK